MKQNNNKTPNRHPPLTAERARELLHYDPETGILRWRIRRGPKRAGSIATRSTSAGYIRVGLDCRTYYAHRVMWLMQTGEWPDKEIDHINGVRTDNRWANLRHATHAQNGRNRRRQRDNTSGFTGVYLHKPTKRWRARINVAGKRISLGYHDTPELAHAAYAGATKAHYGEFARAA